MENGERRNKFNPYLSGSRDFQPRLLHATYKDDDTISAHNTIEYLAKSPPRDA